MEFGLLLLNNQIGLMVREVVQWGIAASLKGAQWKLCLRSEECHRTSWGGSDVIKVAHVSPTDPRLCLNVNLKILLSSSTFLHLYSRCTGSVAKSLLFRFIPILAWLPRYPIKEWLLGDIISGFSVGIMHLPQGKLLRILSLNLNVWVH